VSRTLLIETRKLILDRNARFTSANHTPQKRANLPPSSSTVDINSQKLVESHSVFLNTLTFCRHDHSTHETKMTESSESQTISTQGSFSPAVQKLIALGNKEYALKNYEKAVEQYGEASELQFPLPTLLNSYL
jgi:hypothetical protein